MKLRCHTLCAFTSIISLSISSAALSAEALSTAMLNELVRTQSIIAVTDKQPFEPAFGLIAESRFYNRLRDDILDRFDAARSTKAEPTGAPADNALAFAKAFVSAPQYFLIPLHTDDSVLTAFFAIGRDALRQFADFPDTPLALASHHLKQSLLDNDYLIWPDRPAQDIAINAFRWDITGSVTYADSLTPQVFYGSLSVSFHDYIGQIELASGDDNFGLSFSIVRWQEVVFATTDALLHHQGNDYDAAVLLAHTDLPHAALWSSFQTSDAPANVPVHGQFTNLLLLSAHPDD